MILMREVFRRFAHWCADVFGTPMAFIIAAFIVVAWAFTGPLFGFSDTWQLVINTSTTIVTFLMVFLIQNAQNRDSKAVHLKLDELLRSIKEARNQMIDLEDCSEEELEKYKKEFQAMQIKLRKKFEQTEETLDEKKARKAQTG